MLLEYLTANWHSARVLILLMGMLLEYSTNMASRHAAKVLIRLIGMLLEYYTANWHAARIFPIGIC
jgi:hypothetical protein